MWPKSSWIVACLVMGLHSACSYQSEYVAPQDGRARAVWGSNDELTAELAGVQLSPDCQQAIGQTVSAQMPLGVAEARMAPTYWRPRYYGSPVILIHPGFAPSLPHPPLFLPHSLLSPIRPPFSPGSFSAVGARIGGGGSGGRGGGGGRGLESAAVALLLIAVLTLPAVDLGLALAHPGSSKNSAGVLDLVNAYNDLARSPGSPCAYPTLTDSPPPIDTRVGGQP